MESISNRITLRKGRLGLLVEGQKNHLHGSTVPPSRSRGDISKFSAKSRKRLREVLVKANPIGDGWECFGLCFTIPGDILPQEKVRYLWHDFVMNFKRKFRMPMIWRIELQERRQAHWHALVWANKNNLNHPKVQILNLAHKWRRVVRKVCGPFSERTERGFEAHGVDVRPLDDASATGVVGYLTDHLSKHKQAQLGWQGRQWGVVNRHLLSFETEVIAEVSEETHKQAARQYRRLQERLRARGGKYTGVKVSPAGNVSTAIFGNDEARLLKCFGFADKSILRG